MEKYKLGMLHANHVFNYVILSNKRSHVMFQAYIDLAHHWSLFVIGV